MEPMNQVGGRKQLLIGLDAAEWKLVCRWAQEGKLPAFQRLLATGTSGVLSTTAEQLPDTVWACVYTGVNPAKFEKFFYVQYDPDTQWLKYMTDDEIHTPPFWDYLSEAGKRVAIIDVPKFPVSRKINGYQISNWGAHATKTARASNPPELLEEIDRRFPHHPVGDCDAVVNNPEALRHLREHILEGIRLRGDLTLALMQEKPWDVLFTAFGETHCVGHHFWGMQDPTRPEYDPEDRGGLRDTIEQVYRAIDREIGRILEHAGDDTLVMVFAGHGMGPIYHASWNLPEILEHLGYGKSGAPSRSAGTERRQAKVNPWRLLKLLVPGPIQYKIKAMLPQSMQEKLLFQWYSGGQSWKGCKAFAIPNNDSVGAIRISVKGRDKHGLVEPGEEYRSACRDIANALYELRDPESGRPVVRRVTLTHEVFHGPFLEQLPDLTVLWDQTFAWHAIQSDRLGTLELRKQDGRSGSHTPRGFVIAAGPGVSAGTELKGGSLYDIAATVLNAAGVAVPAEIDGQPLPIQSSPVTV